MNKLKQLAILYPVIAMFLICIVITAALAGTNYITADKIAQINLENENAIKARLIEADSYESETLEEDGEKQEYFRAVKGGSTEGYIFKINEKGYGGTVSVMIAIDPDGAVKAIELLDVSNETPGLGQNTQKTDFTEQYKGRSSEVVAVKFGTKSAENEIDAVASATISSRAVTRAVNRALELSKKIVNTNDGSVDTVSEATLIPTE